MADDIEDILALANSPVPDSESDVTDPMTGMVVGKTPSVPSPATPTANTSGTAAFRGIEQGAALGLADEGAAAADYLISKLPGVRNVAEKANSAAGGHPGLSPIDNPDLTYQQRRDEYRAQHKQAQEEHPVLYNGGQIAGALISSAFLPAPASVAGRIGLGTTQGAVSGFGHSEADNAKDLLTDSAKGAGIGAGASVLGEGINKTLDTAGDAIVKTAVRKQLAPALIKHATNVTNRLEQAKAALASAEESLATPLALPTDEVIKRTTAVDNLRKLVGTLTNDAERATTEATKAASIPPSPLIATIKKGVKSALPYSTIGAGAGALFGSHERGLVDRIENAAIGAAVGPVISAGIRLGGNVASRAANTALPAAAKLATSDLYNTLIAKGISPVVANATTQRLAEQKASEDSDKEIDDILLLSKKRIQDGK